MFDNFCIFAFGAYEVVEGLLDFDNRRHVKHFALRMGLFPILVVCVAAGVARWRVYPVMMWAVLPVTIIVLVGFHTLFVQVDGTAITRYWSEFLVANWWTTSSLPIFAMAFIIFRISRHRHSGLTASLPYVLAFSSCISVAMWAGGAIISKPAYLYDSQAFYLAYLFGTVFTIAALIIGTTAGAAALPLGPRTGRVRKWTLVGCSVLLAVYGLQNIWTGMRMV